MSVTAFFTGLFTAVEWSLLGYFLLVNLFYGVLLVSAAVHLSRHAQRTNLERRRRLIGSSLIPRISVLAPAYDEEATIRDSVLSLLALDYPDLEVVVVNDGSKDGTLEVMKEAFDLVAVHTVVHEELDTRPLRGLYRSRLHGNLVVVDKENGGKADALNAGLNVSISPLVCAIDADTLIEPDALLRMVPPFLEQPDLLAAGGTVRVANGSVIEMGRVREAGVPRHPLAGIQVVEYLRAFLFGRLGWNGLGGNLIISGAFGLFRRDAVVEGGGYLHDTVGEDVELVARVRRRAREEGVSDRVVFVPHPVAWTEVPEGMGSLGRQRDRWHRGLSDTLWRHRRMILNPRYGVLGLVVIPYFLFVELLAPVVEAVGLLVLLVAWPLGLVNSAWAWLFLLFAYGLGVIFTVASILLEDIGFHRYERAGDRGWMLLWALVEPLGYRQATAVWRLRGLIRYLLGRRDWGRMERKGPNRLRVVEVEPPGSGSRGVVSGAPPSRKAVSAGAPGSTPGR